MTNSIKITIAEPSAIIRRGMLSILKKASLPHAEFYEVSDAEQLRNHISRQLSDILVINPVLFGFISLPQIRKDAVNQGMKCVALLTSLTDASNHKYYDEVISVYDNVEQIGEKFSRLISGPETDKRHEALSQREKEVVACVVKGMTNKQIADALCLSTHTVITHRRNISAKLDIHSTAGLTIYAIVNKLIELDDMKTNE